MWAGRVCIFYALLRVGLAGSQSNPLVSGCVRHLCFFISRLLNVFIWKSCVYDCFSSPDLEFSDGEIISDLGFSKWLEVVRGKPGLWDLSSLAH